MCGGMRVDMWRYEGGWMCGGMREDVWRYKGGYVEV